MCNYTVQFLLLSFLISSVLTETSIVPIAGLFDSTDWQQEIAFRYAVDRINMDRMLLPKMRLEPRKDYLNPFDSYSAEKKACNQTQNGVGAIFGPQTLLNTGVVKSICETLEIPNLLTHWDISQDESLRCSINLYPEPHVLSKAIADLVREMKWKSFTLLYDEDASLIYLQEVLKIHGSRDPPITIRQLDESNDHRPLLKEIQSSGETHVILHCQPDRLIDFFKQAQEVKMMEEYQSYVITHLDSHTIDFGEFKYGRTNITSLRIIDPTRSEVMNAVYDWTQGEMRYGKKLDITPETVKAEAAYMYDSLFLLARALHSLESRRNHIAVEPLNCDSVDKWTHGYGLASYMKLLTPIGLSGNMRFDSEGRRIYFELDIIEISKDGFVKIGTWDPDQKVAYTQSLQELESQKMVDFLVNKTFIVSSRLGAPFLMEKESNETLYGNDRYEGYSINLIDEISKELNFKYLFELVPDGKYGSYNKVTKKWDGLVKQLLDRKADLAICDLTITHERESAVDFTMPFMTLGISILYSKPIKQPPQLFSFLSPFSLDVWMYMATAYLGVSLLLFILARISPYEWSNPHPCNNDVEEMETNMNLHNSIWHNCGSLMQQGSDIAPKAVSTRLVAGMWWFFTLIMISSYTANLAAFLTIDRMEIEISSAEDLAQQTKIKYGAVADATTQAFLKVRLQEKMFVSVHVNALNCLSSCIAPSLMWKALYVVSSRAISTRMVSGMWCIFTLIMKSYTANLTAHLTNEKMDAKPIKSLEDLIAQKSPVKYGTVYGSTTAKFFETIMTPMLGQYHILILTQFRRAVSTRMVAGMWWFFTLIMISSYTANLAAFLTVSKMDESIESAEDLAKQTKIKYGAVTGGSTAGFFKNSNHSTYQRMWSAMESARPSVFTSSNAEGVERVIKGKRGYAFVMESTSIEYMAERNCELQQIGGLLDSKGYGIAMPVNSPYRTAISGAVLKMQEDGRLNALKEKWWKQMHGGGSCQEEEDSSSDSAAELGLDNVGGVFVVLVLGCVAGFLMAVLEFLWNIRKIAVEEEISPKEALIKELKFAIACQGTTKPVPKKKSSSQTSLKSHSSTHSHSVQEFNNQNFQLEKN